MPLDFERLQNIVDLAAMGRPADVQDGVNAALADRLADVLPYAKSQVAANMLGQEPVWPEAEDDDLADVEPDEDVEIEDDFEDTDFDDDFDDEGFEQDEDDA